MKEQYYSFFASCKWFIRFKPLLKQCGISEANFSRFMSGKPEYQILVSEAKLETLYYAVLSCCESVTTQKIA